MKKNLVFWNRLQASFVVLSILAGQLVGPVGLAQASAPPPLFSMSIGSIRDGIAVFAALIPSVPLSVNVPPTTSATVPVIDSLMTPAIIDPARELSSTLNAAAPTVSIVAPAAVMLGESFSFTVTFTNPGDVGYGPFLDIVLPHMGVDGPFSNPADGITFDSLSFAGGAVEYEVLTFDGLGNAVHPYAKDISGAPVTVTGTPGDTLIVARLPFGSLVSTQPSIPLTIHATVSSLADLNQPLTIYARAGFMFGANPLDDWCCDPVLYSHASQASTTWASDQVTPALISLTKTYSWLEEETATGPNYLREYTIHVDIADGQTIQNLDLYDYLPDNLQFASLVATSPVAGSCTLPSTITPGGTLNCTYASVTGGSGSNDITVTFNYYAPYTDSVSALVLNACGDDAPSPNNAYALGDWIPLDPRDSGAANNAYAGGQASPSEYEITLKSIATQKSAAVVGGGNPAPGAILEYTIDFQISDYFAMDSIVLTDTISDGQRWDNSFTPTLEVNGNQGWSSSGDFGTTTVTVTPYYSPVNPTPGGTTEISFLVSDELVTRGYTGQLIGGCIPATGTVSGAPDCGAYDDGPTTGQIVFRTVIQENFSDDYPSGDPSVDQGDVLENAVQAEGDILNHTNLSPRSCQEADDSGASVEIPRGAVSKSVYAVNGSAPTESPVVLRRGDVITFQITYTLPTADVEGMYLVDYLPLPIFDASEVTTFTNTVSSTAPAAGEAHFGPSDTFYAYSNIIPTIATDSVQNSVEFYYGNFDGNQDTLKTVDVLFSVTVDNDPFTDRLYLTNQARAFEGSTNSSDQDVNSILQMILSEPYLVHGKGAIASSNPNAIFQPATVGPVSFTAPGSAGIRWSGLINSQNLAANPIDSNVMGVDGGDLISFALVVENLGSSSFGAFDITIKDILPTGFVIPSSGLNLSVFRGDGAAITFTDLGGGLFGNGIQLDDPGAVGACQHYDPTDGQNIAVIIFDLQVDPNIPAGTTIVNSSTITNYANEDGGPDFTGDDNDIVADATTTIALPQLNKSIVTTSESSTLESGSPRPVAVGEIVRFRLETAWPEGYTANAQVVDNLPQGLIFLNDSSAKVAFVVSQTSPASMTSSTLSGAGLIVAGDESTISTIIPTFILPDAAVSNDASSNTDAYSTGTDVRFKLGNLTNHDYDNNVEYVVIEFNALVDNSAAGGNDLGDTRSNNFTVFSNGTTSLSGPSTQTVTVVVQEPYIPFDSTTNNKTVAPAGPQDAENELTYAITMTNQAGANRTTAFDVQVLDNLPSTPLTLTDINLPPTFSGCGSPDPSYTNNSDLVANTIDVVVASMPVGCTVSFTYTATLKTSVYPNQSIPNTAYLTYTSLPGSGTAGNPTGSNTPGASGADNGERNGSGTLSQNDYNGNDNASVTVAVPTLSKTIVTTSQAFTPETGAGNNVANARAVAIGEIVRFRLQTIWPEGTSPDVQIVDQIPTGMIFLDDDSAKILFVADNVASLTSSTLSGGGLIAAGDETNVASLIPTYILPNNAVSANSGSNNDSYQSGTHVRFKIGSIVNTDNDPDNEYIVIEFNALVDNSVTGTNDAGDTRQNNYRVYINNTSPVGSTSNSRYLVIWEPNIPFDATADNKTANPLSGDAGDVVTYTVTYTPQAGTNFTTAFDVRLTDNLSAIPVDLTAVGPVTFNGCVPAAPPYTNASNLGTDHLDLTVATVTIGCQVTVQYNGTLESTVAPGQIITNTANLSYTSLPGVGDTANVTGSVVPGDPGDEDGERTGSGTDPNDYLGSDIATVTIGTVPVKYLASTSESHTTDVAGTERLAVGEIARYRLEIPWPEGSADNVQLQDLLPTGMQFLEGTVKLAFISNDGDPTCTTSTATMDAGNPINQLPWVCGSDATVASITPTWSLTDDSSISASPSSDVDVYNSGTDVYFKFGNMTNSDSDADKEYIVLEFNALVLNETGNQAGTELSNSFAVWVDGTQITASELLNAYVAEPVIAVEKTALSTPQDAGDLATYTIVVTNTASGDNAAAAFDLIISDPLQTYLDLQNAADVIATSIPAYSTFTNNSNASTDQVSVSLSRLYPGDAATLTVTVKVRDTAPVRTTINNTATVTYTSLPGAGTTGNPTGSNTPGASGAANGERNGSGAPLNDYQTTDSASLTLSVQPTFQKFGPTPATFPIGATTTFDLLVTLPEGVTPGLVITDQLPAGLTYVSYTIATSTAQSSRLSADFAGTLSGPAITTPGGVSGGNLVFNFGNVTTTGDGLATNNSFVIIVTVRVNNETGNQSLTNLTNNAQMQYIDAISGSTTLNASPVTVQVVEPVLDIQKAASNTSPQLGEVVTYTLSVSHLVSSNSTAYDVVVSDIIPVDLTYVPASASVPAGWTVDDSAAPTLVFNAANFPVGSTAEITYQVTLPMPPTGTLDTTYTNTATMTWTSLAGPSADERTGSGSPALNDYHDSDNESITVTGPDLTVTKDDGATTYVPGLDTVYTIIVSNVGGAPVNGVHFTDTLPSQIQQWSWVCAGVTGGATGCDDSGGYISTDYSDDLDLPASSSVTYTVTASTDPAATTVLANTAVASLPAGYIDPSPANNSATDNDDPAPQVDLSAFKDDGVSKYTPGDTLTYTITVSNSGPSDAANSVVTDTKPAEIGSWDWTCVDVAPASGCTAYTGSGDFNDTIDLPVGGVVTYTVVADVLSSATGTLTNTVQIDAASGITDTNLTNNQDDDTDIPDIKVNLNVTKTDGLLVYVPGETLIYTIMVGNAGPSISWGSTVTDPIPPEIASWTWTCVDATNGATDCTPYSGSGDFNDTVNLPINSTITYEVSALTRSGATTTLTNTAEVQPGGWASDTDLSDNTAEDSDQPEPHVDLSAVKDDGFVEYIPGLTLTYTITVANNGPSDSPTSTVTDSIPAQFSDWTWTCVESGGASGCSTYSGSGDFSDIISLPLNGVVTYTVTANISSSATGQLDNTVSITPDSAYLDTDLNNNSDTDSDQPNPQADLWLDKDDGSTTYVPGTTVTYTIVVHNDGPSDAPGSIISDLIPTSTQVSSWQWTCSTITGGATGCDGTAGYVSADFNDTVDLPANSSITYIVTATVLSSATGDLLNTARVDVDPVSIIEDPVPGNNQDDDTDAADPQADLQAVKDDGVSEYIPGANLTYTITVSNSGPSDALNSTVTDNIPAEIDNWSWTCVNVAPASGCTPYSGSGNFSDTIDLPAGGVVTYTVTAHTLSSATTTLTNTVRIDTAPGITDIDPSNNEDDDIDTPHITVNLNASKDDGVLIYVPGESVTYTIVVGNAGPSDGMNSLVTDTIPPEITSWSWTCVGATNGAAGCTSYSGSGNFNDALDLPFNSTITYQVVAQTSPSATTTLVNTAEVAAAAGVDEMDLSDNSDDDSDQAEPHVDLSAVKDDGLDLYVPGLTLTYTITVSNSGPSDAPNSTVVDNLPVQFSSWSWTCVESGGASGCTPYSGSGDLTDIVDLPIGSSITYTVTANILSSATGQLDNTVTVNPASGYLDTDLNNNSATDSDQPDPKADLWLDKDDGSTTYVPGTTVTYTIVVHNDGPSDAPGSIVTDAIPPADQVSAWLWTCSTITGGATGCDGTAGYVSTNFSDTVDLPANSSITYIVTATVLSSTTSDLLNTARVDVDPNSIIDETDPGNNQDDDTDTADPKANLTVSKDDFTVPYVPGNFLTYTIVVTNEGPSDAPNSTVVDDLPLQISDWAWSCTGSTGGASGCTPYVGSGNFSDLLDLPAHSSITYTVLAHVFPAASGDLVNTVTVAPPSTVDELDDTDNVATDTDTINPLVDLMVTKDDGLDQYVPGTVLTYVVTVSNLGPSNAPGSVVTDAIPSQASSWTWTCFNVYGGASGCNGVTGSTANFTDTVNLPIGSSITYHVTVVIRPDATGDLYNMASVSVGPGVTDINPNNNSDDDTDQAHPQVDLSALKDDNQTLYVPGTSLVYSITVANSGPSDAPSSTVTDNIPAQFSSWNWTCVESGGASGCSAYSGSGNFTDVINLPVNSVVTYTVTAQILSSATGQLDNTVTVSPPGGIEDTAPGNNSATDTDQPDPQMDLTITKTDGLPTYTPGHPQVYTITVTNSGPSDAYDAVVSDLIPAGFSMWRWECTSQTGGANGCTPTADTALDFSDTVNIPVGGTILYTVTAQVRLSAVGLLTNTATITPGPGQTDPSMDDNSASDTDDVLQPDLTLTKDDGGVNALPGGLLTYTLTYNNVGGYPAYGVYITDRVPTYTTFVAASSTVGWICVPDNNAGSLCRFDVGTVLGASGGTVTFAVQVQTPLPSGVEEIANAAMVADDGSAGPDPTPDDNRDDVITPVIAAPDLVIVKADGVDVVAVGSRITYQLTISNVGNQDAVGVLVQDTLPAGLDFVSASHSGVYTDAVRTITWPLFDLPAGSSVTRTVVVDVQNPLPDGVESFLNFATAMDDGSNGDDPTPANNSAQDLDQLGAASKSILDTNQSATTLLDVAIGEMVQYEVTLNVPTGTLNNLVLSDLLDRGLVFVDCEILATDTLTSSPVALDAVCDQSRVISPEPVTSTNPADSGRRMRLSFGSLTNSGTETTTLRVRYWVVVLDSAENVDGVSLLNQAQWTWNGGVLDVAAQAVQIVEPKLALTKEVNVGEVLPGSEVTYTLTVSHTADSHSDAFNVTLTDIVPNAVQYVPGSLVWVSGAVPTAIDDTTQTLLVTYDVFTNTATASVLQFRAIVNSSVGAGTTIRNTAVLAWTSLPEDLSLPQSPYNNLSTERRYLPGSGIDIYGVEASASIGVPGTIQLPETGFAPGMVTALPVQPVSISYAETAVRLQIPSLGVDIPVVGVPLTEDGWDVTWLNKQAGWLAGTAFPTWNGNSVLTAHVFDANGLPGPFVNLYTLRYGTPIYIVTGGLRYRFEVRQTYYASPTSLGALRHEDLPWLTLITCRGYNEATDSYAQRMVVRAVLVAVEP